MGYLLLSHQGRRRKGKQSKARMGVGCVTELATACYKSSDCLIWWDQLPRPLWPTTSQVSLSGDEGAEGKWHIPSRSLGRLQSFHTSYVGLGSNRDPPPCVRPSLTAMVGRLPLSPPASPHTARFSLVSAQEHRPVHRHLPLAFYPCKPVQLSVSREKTVLEF